MSVRSKFCRLGKSDEGSSLSEESDETPLSYSFSSEGILDRLGLKLKERSDRVHKV
jgi:hypothetical protein